MATGRAVLDDIQRKESALQSEISQLVQAHQRAQAELNARREQARGLLEQLAAHRVDALAARESLTRLGEADARAQAAIATRETELAQTEAALVQAEASVRLATEEAQAREVEYAAARDVAAAEFATLLATLRADPSFATTEATAQEATQRLEKARAHQSQLDGLRAKHEPAYMADPLFRYLHERGYGTTRYRAWPLLSALDAWVARLSQFNDAARKYEELTQLPTRLQQHVANLAADADRAHAALTRLVDVAMSGHPAGAAHSQLEKALAAANAAQARRADLEAQASALQATRTKLVTRTDPHTQAATQVLMQALSALPDAQLLQVAGQTVSPDDDRSVEQLQALRVEIADYEAQVERLAAEVETPRQQAKQLSRVVSEFRSRGYGDSDARFGAGFDVGDLLTGYLLGRVSAGSFWGTVDSHHSVYVPPATRSSSSSGGSFGGGSFGGGGGGGGYSTSDSF